MTTGNPPHVFQLRVNQQEGVLVASLSNAADHCRWPRRPPSPASPRYDAARPPNVAAKPSASSRDAGLSGSVSAGFVRCWRGGQAAAVRSFEPTPTANLTIYSFVRLAKHERLGVCPSVATTDRGRDNDKCPVPTSTGPDWRLTRFNVTYDNGQRPKGPKVPPFWNASIDVIGTVTISCNDHLPN